MRLAPAGEGVEGSSFYRLAAPNTKWIIDFGWTMSEAAAALREAAFQYRMVRIEPDGCGDQRRRRLRHPLDRAIPSRSFPPGNAYLSSPIAASTSPSRSLPK